LSSSHLLQIDDSINGHWNVSLLVAHLEGGREATRGHVKLASTLLIWMMQVLGQWYEKGKVLIFVQSQEKCDTLFRDLLKVQCQCERLLLECFAIKLVC
jgi:hypothetical protein